MRKSEYINKFICAILILLLIFGMGNILRGGEYAEPDDPTEEQISVLQADLQDGGSGAVPEKTQDRNDELKPPEEQPPEDVTPPEQDKKDQPSESDQSKPSEQTEPSGKTDPEGPADPDDPTESDDPGPSDDVKITTDLPDGIVTQEELPDGLLKFYAYGTGADDLSVRVRVRNTKAASGTWLDTADGRNWQFRMDLGETYQFTLYLDQPGKPAKYTTRYITYQAKLADEDDPEVGDYPPFITTNIDHYENYAEIEGENLAMIVTVRSNPDYKVITADKIIVKVNGVTIDKHGGDSSPEYDIYFEPPNVGDYKDYKIEIVAWHGNNSRYWTKTLRYHAIADGDAAGTVNVVLDATTVGVGILDSAEYEIKKGDTAADVFLRFLEDYGYDITYDSTGSNFYIRRISRGDMCHDAAVPAELWEAIQRDGINLNEGQHDSDSLGEFDYTMGAGWMYAVDGNYPGRSMNRYEVKNGNTIYVRFSLSYGKDIGGFDSTGGGYGYYSSYCGLWIGGGYQELGHDYSETDRKEPTETEAGYKEYTCSNCGKKYREEIPATGPAPHEHSYAETGRVEPTCTEDGYVEYTCSCGDSYRETLEATGHSYTETDRKEPTETEDGYIEYTCSCGDSYREILPATGGNGGDGGDG